MRKVYTFRVMIKNLEGQIETFTRSEWGGSMKAAERLVLSNYRDCKLLYCRCTSC